MFVDGVGMMEGVEWEVMVKTGWEGWVFLGSYMSYVSSQLKIITGVVARAVESTPA